MNEWIPHTLHMECSVHPDHLKPGHLLFGTLLRRGRSVSVCCGGPRVVLCVLHCTDVVCPSPGVLIPAPCCESVVDQLCSRHCGSGGPPPADVGQPASIEASCTSWTRRTGWSLRSLTAWLPIPAIPPIGAWSTWDSCRAGRDRWWHYPVLMGCVRLIMLWVWFTTSITNNQATYQLASYSANCNVVFTDWWFMLDRGLRQCCTPFWR